MDDLKEINRNIGIGIGIASVTLVFLFMIPPIDAQENIIPSWFKFTTAMWIDEKLTDEEFISRPVWNCRFF